MEDNGLGDKLTIGLLTSLINDVHLKELNISRNFLTSSVCETVQKIVK